MKKSPNSNQKKMIAAAIIAAAIILVSVCAVLLYNNWIEFNTPAQTEAITDPSAADAVAKMETEGTSSDSESKDSTTAESDSRWRLFCGRFGICA